MIQLLLILVVLIGLAKCVAIARRPTTNRKCVASLMCLLGAWLVSIAASWLFILLPGAGPGLMFVVLLPVALVIAAAVLALSGLKEYSRSQGYYSQGQNQAMAALFASGVLLLLLGFATMSRLDLFSRRRAIGGQPLVFEQFHLKFLHPGPGWTEMQANSLDTNAVVALHFARPELNLLVVPGKSPGTNYTFDDLAALALHNQSNAMEDVRVTYRGPAFADGLEGVRLHSEATFAGRKLYCQHRLILTGEWSYQIIVWGPDRTTVADEADHMALRFQILNLDRGSMPPASPR